MSKYLNLKLFNITGFIIVTDGENDNSHEDIDESPDNESDQEGTVKKSTFLSAEEKIRILKIVRENPSLTLKELKKNWLQSPYCHVYSSEIG